MKNYTITDFVNADRQVVTEIYHGEDGAPVVLVGHAATVVTVEAGRRMRDGVAVHQAFLAGVYAAHCGEGVWP